MFHQFDKATHRCNCGRWQAGFKPKATDTCECQVCANQQKVDARGKLVLHGYLRPGHGWIIGKCFGVAALPFPETDRLEYWEKSVEGSINSSEIFTGCPMPQR